MPGTGMPGYASMLVVAGMHIAWIAYKLTAKSKKTKFENEPIKHLRSYKEVLYKV